MRVSRRRFLIGSICSFLTSWGLPIDRLFASLPTTPSGKGGVAKGTRKEPVVISTWKHGFEANEKAYSILTGGGRSLDAVEMGVRVSENDPEVTGVGLGGLPDETGIVTLDASIMSPDGNAGAVGALRNIKNPISVARKVMEETDHVFLVGEGALSFAKAHGFKEEYLLTDASRERWLRWKQKMSDVDDWLSPVDDHDTIGMVARDSNGDVAGACTTSGLAFKIHGRVGDSPIPGAGMYVANEVGGAAATGRGEAVIKICGSFLVVELMRRGKTPQRACEIAAQRIIDANDGKPDFQVAFIALSSDGEHGAVSIQEGFEFALSKNGKTELLKSKHLL
ncbi:MAG: N(4)-(beta-N-acetylglucosaminyl)-L-asparaginase [Candidatus Glassbacteria bacterium]